MPYDYQTCKKVREKHWSELDNRHQCAHKDPNTGHKCRNYLGVMTTEYTLCSMHAPKRCQEMHPNGGTCQALLHDYHVRYYTCKYLNDKGEPTTAILDDFPLSQLAGTVSEINI